MPPYSGGCTLGYKDMEVVLSFWDTRYILSDGDLLVLAWGLRN